MSPTLRKTIAVLMICVTSVGILLSLFFLVQTWRIRQPATEKLQSALRQTSGLLQTTLTGLDVIDQVVTNVYSSTLYLDDATNALAQTIQNTGQFINSAGTFVGEDFSNTITNTQRTLESAQSSALVIDNILTTLSNVPLIGINYNPSVPLNVALGEVSASLDPLQKALKGFQDNLATTQTNMQDFKDQILLVGQNITVINQNLASSKTVIDNYHAQVTSLQSWVDKAISSTPTWVSTMCVIISILLLLLVLVQAGILLQGIYLLSSPATEPTDTREQ
jgi:predicted PurR-regulated permease PerM